MKRVLVIKLAALGDFVQAIGAMRRIRAAHPSAHLTLLTTSPYGELAQATGLFDAIDLDGRPRGLSGLGELVRRLRRGGYDRVYDLQTSRRSSLYRAAFWPRFPEWSGIARGASHPHAEPGRDAMHTLERQADQLRHAGVWPDAPIAPGAAPPTDLGFLVARLGPDSQPAALGVEAPYVLLVPGASPMRPAKRWAAERYAALARRLRAAELTPVIIGGPTEAALAARIAQEGGAVDLAGRTEFAQVAALGAGAAGAVGNDTGPMHLIAAAGAPTLVLFSADSDPALCAPRGARVRVLRAPTLDDLEVDTVAEVALAMAVRAPAC